MKTTERVRLLAKSMEFRLPPNISGLLLPLAGISSPFRPAEHRLRCIFIHVPKAAGTSIAKVLFDDKSRHIPISRYYAFDQGAASSYFKFSFVRNPWARMYSAYQYLAKRINADPRHRDHRWATFYLAGTRDFSGFLRRMKADRSYRMHIRRYAHFRDQLDWICFPGSDTPVLDFVGRYERISGDFSLLASRLNITMPLPHERVGDRHGYGDCYSPQEIAFVGDLYRRDIRYFGYEFDPQ